jgi:ABC-type transport system substrate-binding protein
VRAKTVLVAIVLAVVAAACEGGGGIEAARQGNGDPGAEIRIAAAGDPWPDQGRDFRSSTFAYPLNVNVYETLVVLDSDYVPRPGLAESWELVPPGTWRFHLRHGVVFHDGRPFTADDVMWTWAERQRTAPTADGADTLGDNSVRRVDDFTVDFTPKVANRRFPEQVLHPGGAILARGRHFDTLPAVGTGPFKVVDYRPGDSVTLVRNDGYWGSRAQARRLTFRFVPDPAERVHALTSRQVDVVLDLPADAVKEVKADRNVRVVTTRPGRNHLIYVNKGGQAPHDLGADRAVRQALSLAVDRAGYARTVLHGLADAGRWMAPKSMLGPSAAIVVPVPFDPGKARALLDADGWKPGPDGIRVKGDRRLTLSYLGTPEVPVSAPLFLQRGLRDVGIDLEVEETPDAATRNTLYRLGDYDLDFELPNQNDGNPAFLPVLHMYSKSPGSAQFAPGGEFDAVAEKSLAATTTSELQQASAQMMKILINDEFIVVPAAGAYRILAVTKAVDLGDPHPSQANQSWVTLSKRSG